MDKVEMGDKIKRFWKSGLINLVTIGIAAAYVLYNEVTLQTTELQLWSLLTKAGIGILCGVLIKQGLGENGFTIGYNSKQWGEEMDKYNTACNTANQYMDRVENFYYSQEIEKRIEYRRKVLMGVRLRYIDFFDDNENFIGQEKMAKLDGPQKRAVKRCVKVKIYNLNLFSEYSRETASATKKETGDQLQRVKMLGKNSISQTLFAIAGAYFVPVMDGWNWGSFIFATLQVIWWCGAGVMQSYNNYNYIVVDKVNKLKTKKELIQKFVFGCNRGLYMENPYEVRERGKYEEVKAIEMEVETEVKNGASQDNNGTTSRGEEETQPDSGVLV